jgi:putative acyl-CoA dehydrogenase
MTTVPRFDTNDVFNQSPPYENVDLFLSDLPLREAVEANGAGSEIADLSTQRAYGATLSNFTRPTTT